MGCMDSPLSRSPQRDVGRRRALVWLARVLAVVALTILGMLLGLRLAGPVTQETRLGTVSLRIAAAWHGEVDAFIPIANWGVRADAFSAPLRIEVEPRSVNRDALLDAVGGDPRVLANVEEDAHDAARSALLRALLWAVAGALVAGALLALVVAVGRRRSTPSGRRGSRAGLVAWSATPAIVAAAIGGAALARTSATFDPAAFDSPRFYARGAELGELLKVAEKAQTATDEYSSSVQRTLSGYATILSAGARLAPLGTSSSPAALISDLHGNALVLPALERLFGGGPVFFAGDLGQRGSPAEARALIPQVAGLGGRLVAVSGNHDSSYLMRRLAGAGVVVLTDRGRLRADGQTDGEPVQRIGDLRVAGYPDPLEWRAADPNDPRRIFSFSERPDGERELAQAQERLVRWFERLAPRPDVVLIHQNGLAQGLARALRGGGYGHKLLILTGHDHRQHIDRYGSVLVVDAGTAGAGGAFGVGTEPVGVAQLQLRDGAGGQPRAVDLVQVEPLSGAAQADRVVLGSARVCEHEDVNCHDDSGDGR